MESRSLIYRVLKYQTSTSRSKHVLIDRQHSVINHTNGESEPSSLSSLNLSDIAITTHPSTFDQMHLAQTGDFGFQSLRPTARFFRMLETSCRQP